MMSHLNHLGTNILLRSPNWLGDAVMTLPAVQFLRTQLPAATHLTVLTPTKLADFWRLVPGLHSVLLADDNIAITADTIKAQAFDTAILFPNSLRSALEPWLARIPQRYGFTGHSRNWLLSDSWPRPSNDKGWVHHQLHYLELIQHLIPTAAATPPFQPLTTTTIRPYPEPYLVVCPGAEYGAAKRWPLSHYAEAINKLTAKYHLKIILLGSANDIPTSLSLTQLLKVPPYLLHNLTGQTSLATFIQHIAHASLVLCNDSGSMHLAAAFGTRTVAIFGSTEPLLTGPIHPSVEVIRHHVPCSPCFLRECPIDFRCMNAVSADEVVHAAAPALKPSPKSQP